MHVNCADFVYRAMGELIQVLYRSEMKLHTLVGVPLQLPSCSFGENLKENIQLY